MPEKIYGKLVRDKIPDIISEQGRTPICDIPPHGKCLDMLAAKLTEEAAEYLESREPEELADVLEVIHGILLHTGMTFEYLEEIRRKKYDERGGFEKGIRLISVGE